MTTSLQGSWFKDTHIPRERLREVQIRLFLLYSCTEVSWALNAKTPNHFILRSEIPMGIPSETYFLCPKRFFLSNRSKNDLLLRINAQPTYNMRIAVFIFIASTIYSCGNNPPVCFNNDCIFLNGNHILYEGVFIDRYSDTTYYELEMITSGRRFLLQNRLKYVVRRIPDARHPLPFIAESTTGFTETESHIWLHPPRSDKFRFITQLAPYPEAHLPVQSGDTIKGSLRMLNRWGEWSGKSSTFYLAMVGDTVVDFNNDQITAYVMRGCGSILQDTSCVVYLFNYSHGFFYANYRNNRHEQFLLKSTGVAPTRARD